MGKIRSTPTIFPSRSRNNLMKRAVGHPHKELLLLWVLFGSLAVCAQESQPGASIPTAAATAQSEATDSARTVSVYWQRARSVQATGVTQAIALDPSICAVSITTDAVNFTGVSRGDVLVLVWFGERRQSWLISVVDPPF